MASEFTDTANFILLDFNSQLYFLATVTIVSYVSYIPRSCVMSSLPQVASCWSEGCISRQSSVRWRRPCRPPRRSCCCTPPHPDAYGECPLGQLVSIGWSAGHNAQLKQGKYFVWNNLHYVNQISTTSIYEWSSMNDVSINLLSVGPERNRSIHRVKWMADTYFVTPFKI